MNIHLIETSNHFVKLGDDLWESGSWALSEDQAKALVGGEIYFHKKRQEPSFYGGTILDYRIGSEGENRGKVVFKLQYIPSCRNVSTDKTGWCKAIKIARLEQ